jgi:hypothetical protein
VKWRQQTPDERVGRFLRDQKHQLSDSTAQFYLSTSVHTPATSYVPKNNSPKELGQVTSVAEQPHPAAQSNGFENVD